MSRRLVLVLALVVALCGTVVANATAADVQADVSLEIIGPPCRGGETGPSRLSLQPSG